MTVTGALGAEGRYWEALNQGRLELPRCANCHRWHWPAVWRCGECGSWDHDWQEVALCGTVFTWTRTHHPFAGTEAFGTPFTTLLVSLSGTTVRLNGVLIGDADALKIGARVTGEIDRTAFAGETMPALRWRLA